MTGEEFEMCHKYNIRKVRNNFLKLLKSSHETIENYTKILEVI